MIKQCPCCEDNGRCRTCDGCYECCEIYGCDQLLDGSVVYCVRSTLSGYLKIGTTKHVRQRLSAIATATGGKIEIVGMLPGDAEAELVLHKRFAAHRKLGEWFDDVQEIREVFVAGAIGTTGERKRVTSKSSGK